MGHQDPVQIPGAKLLTTITGIERKLKKAGIAPPSPRLEPKIVVAYPSDKRKSGIEVKKTIRKGDSKSFVGVINGTFDQLAEVNTEKARRDRPHGRHEGSVVPLSHCYEEDCRDCKKDMAYKRCTYESRCRDCVAVGCVHHWGVMENERRKNKEKEKEWKRRDMEWRHRSHRRRRSHSASWSSSSDSETSGLETETESGFESDGKSHRRRSSRSRHRSHNGKRDSQYYEMKQLKKENEMLRAKKSKRSRSRYEGSSGEESEETPTIIDRRPQARPAAQHPAPAQQRPQQQWTQEAWDRHCYNERVRQQQQQQQQYYQQQQQQRPRQVQYQRY